MSTLSATRRNGKPDKPSLLLGFSEIVCGIVQVLIYQSERFSVLTAQLDDGRRIPILGPLPTSLTIGSRIAVRGAWQKRESPDNFLAHDPLLGGDGEYLRADAVLCHARVTVEGNSQISGQHGFIVLTREVDG